MAIEDLSNKVGSDLQIAQVHKGLETILTEGSTGNFAIFTVDEEKNYYVQATAERDGDWLYLEAVSDRYLQKPHRLSEGQTAALKSSGWEDPDRGSKNFHQLFDLADPNDLVEGAVLIIDTLRRVYGLGEEGAIEGEIVLE